MPTSWCWNKHKCSFSEGGGLDWREVVRGGDINCQHFNTRPWRTVRSWTWAFIRVISLVVVMGNSSMCDERVTWASPLWHPHKFETWGPFFTTQLEHLCKTVNRTINIISTILQKDLFYFILLPSKQSDMSNFPAKVMPHNCILYNLLRAGRICFIFLIILLLEYIYQSRFFISSFYPKLDPQNPIFLYLKHEK